MNTIAQNNDAKLSCFKCKLPKLELIKIDRSVTLDSSCNLCGIPLNNNTYIKMCTASNCKAYKLCMNCNICTKGHMLIKAYKISQHANPDRVTLYTEDKFCCDICRITRKTAPFIFRCIQCKYDICHTHPF